MMDIATVISAIFILIGAVFLWIAAIGIIRFPDFYSRLHAAGIGDTLGMLLVTVGIMIRVGWALLSLKIFIVFVLYLLINPLGTNLIIIGEVHSRNYQNYNNKRAGEPGEEVRDVESDA